MASVVRLSYGELSPNSLPKSLSPLVKRLVDSVIGFESGFERISRKRFEAHNFDIYGYDVARKLVVIQFRRAQGSKYGVSVQKQYVLAGVDEGQDFFHILPTSPRQKKDLATTSPQELVRWCESKIFGVKPEQLSGIVRQGDVALVPVKRVPEGLKALPDVTFRDSHKLEGAIFQNPETDEYFVNGAATLTHTKNEHGLKTVTGTFRVVCGESGARRDWLNGPVD